MGLFWLMILPPILLGLWAQMRVKTTYARAQQMPAQLSGAAAARHVLDSAGLQDVEIEQIGGVLSDHYDPRHRVLRLSPQVYQGRTLASVDIAAHEAGHAIQHARHYAPLVIRNAAVPLASFGSTVSMVAILLGAGILGKYAILVGIAGFAAVAFFQLVNLPVEFDASARAKDQLVALGIVSSQEMGPVKSVLGAAALTYVAATLQSVMQLAYYAMIFLGGSRSDQE